MRSRLHPFISTALVVVLGLPVLARAASLPTASAGESLLHATHLERLTVGGGAELFEREINIEDGSRSRLKGETILGYIGIDLTSWLTIFGEAGVSEVSRIDGIADAMDLGDDTYWAAGMVLRAWDYRIEPPAPLAGRLSLSILGQVGHYASSGSGMDVEWQETVIAIPVAYEVAASESGIQTVQSAVFSAGPIFSSMDGDITRASGLRSDFDEQESVGILGGVDVFMLENLSFGGQVHIFDKLTYTMRVRVHF